MRNINGFWRYCPIMMGNQMENTMEHDMASGFMELGGSRAWVSVFVCGGCTVPEFMLPGFDVFGFRSASFGGGAVA